MSNDLSDDASFDDRLDKMVSSISGQFTNEDEDDTNTVAKALVPAGETVSEPEKKAIGEEQLKTNEKELAEPSVKAIEPPISWPSDDKEAFKALPTWTQELLVRRENEREAFVNERSRTIAARERDLNDIQARTAEAQSRYANELQRLNQLATTLLPAKFADIASEADYLRLKVDNPQRANEYEAFVQIMQSSRQQEAQVHQQRFIEQIDREYSALSEKFPEFKDTAKANEILNEVRSVAVEIYGFTPQEVANISDHRHVPILRDAIAYRKQEAQRNAIASKKVPLQSPGANLRTSGVASPSIMSEQKKNTINLARNSTDMNRQAELIASLL